MRSESFAEWIIARFTTRERAASIVGDLLEAVPQKGKMWFWLSVARVFFSLTWRQPLAYTVAAVAVLAWVRAYRFTAFGRTSAHPVSQEWMDLYLCVFRANAQLSVGLAYAAIVYGFKDPFVRRIAVVWTVFQAMIFFGTTPGVAVACCLLTASALAHSFSSATGRRGILALTVTAIFCVVWMMLMVPLLVTVFAGFHAGWWALLRRGVPSYVSPSMGVALNLTELVALTLVFSCVHRLFFRHDSRDVAQGSAEIS